MGLVGQATSSWAGPGFCGPSPARPMASIGYRPKSSSRTLVPGSVKIRAQLLIFTETPKCSCRTVQINVVRYRGKLGYYLYYKLPPTTKKLGQNQTPLDS